MKLPFFPPRHWKECHAAPGGAGDPDGDHEDSGETGHAGLSSGGAEAEGEGRGQRPGESGSVQGLWVSLDVGDDS